MAIFMTLRREWDAKHADTGESVKIPAGRHEVERIPYPRYHCHWLVLKGTRIGASEGSWRQWTEVDGWPDDEFRIVIEEIPDQPKPKRVRGVRRDPELDDPMYSVEANPGRFVPLGTNGRVTARRGRRRREHGN
jgi:hypothetical protein